MNSEALFQFSLACFVLFGSSSALILAVMILFRTLKDVEAELWRIRTFREWAESGRSETARDTE